MTQRTRDNTELNNSINSKVQDTLDLRRIPKVKLTSENVHEIYLLEETHTHFVDAEIIDAIDEYQLKFNHLDELIPFNSISEYSKAEKLRYLFNISELFKLLESRYTFELKPSELYFTINGIPKIRNRGLKGIVTPLSQTTDLLLAQYKALVISTFNKKVTYDTLIQGNLELYKGTRFENEVLNSKSLKDLSLLLKQSYESQITYKKQHVRLVNKKLYFTFKWSSIVLAVALFALLSYSFYVNYAVVKRQHTILKGYESYITKNYTQVLNQFSKLDGKKLSKSDLYLYARSYIQTNQQDLDKEKKENLLNNITENTNKDYLLYWYELGHGHLDQALNIATYIDDNDLTKLALINKITNIKKNPKLNEQKRAEQSKKYNEKLQNIIDKEKGVKEEQEKSRKDKEEKQNKKQKQQEENEKKQKKQELEDKKKKREAERK
ncbi:type VII secretion protein EssB [Staphylococcus pettenkoferi]|uniref:type VII secretion protein EssB n=1 Tax=Staphylococcus pettenkoferi TaxID=170573 RepID=UPI00069F5B24|nr:type VII secretion protein EssB [Staphylococcus pettenkoferi]MDK7283151.1 type VII secretion protein EssB [Staphylococcus pettenkoferi]